MKGDNGLGMKKPLLLLHFTFQYYYQGQSYSALSFLLEWELQLTSSHIPSWVKIEDKNSR